MIGIPVGLLYANAFEWAFHKYVLHGLGKNKKSFWSFHFHEHHREARKNNMRDPGYERSVWSWNAQGKEALALFAGSLVVTPLFPVAPFFVTTVWASELRYYFVHKKSHLDPEWAKEKLPWHYAHHMGRDQDKNWCVTHPFFDKVMGTFEPMPAPAPKPAVAVAVA
jgi:sterol desaturase/sphingolipid hydroxylase (fatty acid hydroxylase superfamily)